MEYRRSSDARGELSIGPIRKLFAIGISATFLFAEEILLPSEGEGMGSVHTREIPFRSKSFSILSNELAKLFLLALVENLGKREDVQAKLYNRAL